jgi:hypothetical protein
MTSDDLVNFVDEQMDRLRTRIVGVGDDQYSGGDTQKFEQIPIDELFEMSEEELDDIVVYTMMLKIRLARLRHQVGYMEERVTG